MDYMTWTRMDVSPLLYSYSAVLSSSRKAELLDQSAFTGTLEDDKDEASSFLKIRLDELDDIKFFEGFQVPAVPIRFFAVESPTKDQSR